jgi:16S rRNA (adenine1518-N6/adenine1519-N6)-dimethyltransferase
MPQDKKEIQSILGGRSPRHRFGQNFMIDMQLVEVIANAGELSSIDTVIEVGPGTGTLTQVLLSRAGRVIAVEIDRDLAKSLRATYATTPQFTLIEGDAMDGKHALNPALLELLRGQTKLKLVANLPYHIASPLVVELLLAGVETLVFTVQKEVAQRLKSDANDDDYGGLTVMVQLLAKVEYLRTIGPGAFWPQPDIDSALVRLTRHDQFGSTDPRAFSKFVHQLFSFRRKTLGKSLGMMDIDTSRVGLDLKARVETISPPQLLALFRLLFENQ